MSSSKPSVNMKNGGVAVDGDVGQVVAGNVVHEGANANSHMSNVITISTGEPLPPVRTITELQRKRIAAKVKEVMQVAGVERQLDVYSVVLSDFGVEKILDLPCGQFKSVMSMLDNWIVEARGEPPGSLCRQSDVTTPAHSECTGCAALSARLDGTRQTLRFLKGTAIVAMGLAAYSLYANATWPAADATNPSTSLSCRHDGKEHSIGSMVRMPDNSIYECAALATSGDMASWVPARGVGGKRRL
ncbi:hypothetical protein [Cupriavidus basilensis]|uniref:hypothetical protein n=1 Tax=Cupriavidus basilensis TaxID=68895 RepID=UPI001185C4CF|nr:hypothetical protein [Cupriavidus basilensis]